MVALPCREIPPIKYRLRDFSADVRELWQGLVGARHLALKAFPESVLTVFLNRSNQDANVGTAKLVRCFWAIGYIQAYRLRLTQEGLARGDDENFVIDDAAIGALWNYFGSPERDLPWYSPSIEEFMKLCRAIYGLRNLPRDDLN